MAAPGQPPRRSAPGARAAAPDPARTLRKALLRAATRLALPPAAIAELVGVQAAALARGGIDPDTKAGELAALFLRVYRSLDALLGGDAGRCREWLHAENDHLGGRPAELIRSARGLVHVADYLDAMRGRA